MRYNEESSQPFNYNLIGYSILLFVISSLFYFRRTIRKSPFVDVHAFSIFSCCSEAALFVSKPNLKY